MKGEENDETEEFIGDDEDGSSFGDGPGAIKRLRERLKKAVAEKQEYLDGWQRARAEFTNFKRREEDSRKEKDERSKAEIIEHILPAMDTLELALRHDAGNTTLKMLWNQFLRTLKDVGVSRIGSEGEKFDPGLHEPLREVETEEPNFDHTIAAVERSGYAVGDTVIRPAHVSVHIVKNPSS